MSTIIVNNNQGIVRSAGEQGPMGPSGSSGTGSALEHPFSWGVVSILPLSIIPANKLILKIEIVLKEVYNDIATLTIGDAGNPNSIISIDDISLVGLNTYQVNPNLYYLAPTQINLYTTLVGNVSSGSGIILLYIQE